MDRLGDKHLDIREAWEQSLTREGHVRDPAQEALVGRLQTLQQELESRPPRAGGWLARLLPGGQRAVRGLYIWGGVGRGKTFLMDLFFETLGVEDKRRMHFHRMMHDVHARRRVHADLDDPLDRVAADIAREVGVLCFDEFFVSDIGDAMILGRLLEGLFDRGVTLIATSNAHPDDLYRDGLERILARQRKDPLSHALHRFDRRLLELYAEVRGDLQQLLDKATGPHHLFHMLTEDAGVRLHMTRRLIALDN